MKDRIKLDYSALLPFVSESDLAAREERVLEALRILEKGEGPGAEFRGWISHPETVPREEIQRLSDIADEVRAEADALIVIGIGGSYLGSRAVIESMTHGFSSLLPREKRDGPLIFFAGQNLSGKYLHYN